MKFLSPRKRKTLRSLLGALSLFTTGTPVVAEAQERSPERITRVEQDKCTSLVNEYMPLCAQLEGNLPYCYLDNGVIAVGCGVHFKDFKTLQNLSAVKVTPKKGASFSLKNLQSLQKMADTNLKTAVGRALFPEVEKAEVVKLSACVGECPKNTDRTWGKSLFILPESTLKRVNRQAAQFCVQKAYEYHPNLFCLPPSARLVVVDLIYNLGHNKYFKKYPKFKGAIQSVNLDMMKKECRTKNTRRDMVRECLISSAILSKNNLCLTKNQILQQIRIPVVQKTPKLAPVYEKSLWQLLDGWASKNFDWQQAENYARMIALNRKSTFKNNSKKM